MELNWKYIKYNSHHFYPNSRLNQVVSGNKSIYSHFYSRRFQIFDDEFGGMIEPLHSRKFDWLDIRFMAQFSVTHSSGRQQGMFNSKQE